MYVGIHDMALLCLHVHPSFHFPGRVQPPHLQGNQKSNQEKDKAHKVLFVPSSIQTFPILITRGQRKEMGLAMMLLCVVAIFFICHILGLVVNILEV